MSSKLTTSLTISMEVAEAIAKLNLLKKQLDEVMVARTAALNVKVSGAGGSGGGSRGVPEQPGDAAAKQYQQMLANKAKSEDDYFLKSEKALNNRLDNNSKAYEKEQRNFEKAAAAMSKADDNRFLKGEKALNDNVAKAGKAYAAEQVKMTAAEETRFLKSEKALNNSLANQSRAYEKEQALIARRTLAATPLVAATTGRQNVSVVGGRTRVTYGPGANGAVPTVPKMVDPAADFRAGINGALAGVANLAASILTIGAIAKGVWAGFKSGLDINAEIETATLGIKTLVASVTTIKDAGGNVVNDTGKKLEIAAGIAEEQVRKLRIQGLQTAATSVELIHAFQQGISAGAQAGLTLDQTREITVGIVQAAGALGMPMNQLNEEVRSLLRGTITVRNTIVATSLGITNKDINSWKQAGTLAEELNKRLAVFKVAGAEAGQTWIATLSNTKEAFQLVMGTMAKGSFDTLRQSMNTALGEVFDIKNFGINEQFKALANVGTGVFDGIGRVLNDALIGGVQLAKDLSVWFEKHADEVTVIGNIFGVIYENVKGVLGTMVSAVGALVNWGTETGVIREAFKLVAITVAMIQDGFSLWKGVLADVGGYIIDKVGGPLRTVLGSLRDFVAQIPGIGTGLASAIDTLLRAIPKNGDALHSMARGIQADFDAGRTAVNRTNKELSMTAQQLREIAAEREREARRGKKSTDGSSGPPPKAPDDKAAKEAAAAEKRMEDAKRKYAADELAASKKIAEAVKAQNEALLDSQLQDYTISKEKFLQEKLAIDKKALSTEIAAALKDRAEIQRQIDDGAPDKAGKKDPAKVKSLEGDVLKLNALIKELETKGVVLDTKFKLDTTTLHREIDALRIEIHADIVDMQGLPLQAALERLDAATSLKRLAYKDDPKTLELIDLQDSLKRQQLNLGEEKRIIDEKKAYMTLAEDEIAYKVSQGQMTALEAERAVREERLKTADAIWKQVEALQALADANPTNGSLALAAKQAAVEWKKLNTTLDATASGINRDLASAGSGIAQSLREGKGAIESLGAAMQNVFGSLATRVLKQFEDKLFNAFEGSSGQGLGGMLSDFIFGSSGGTKGNNPSAYVAGGGGGLFSGIASLFGFANGGYTGDGEMWDYAGPAHKGEFYFSKAEVAKIGLPYLFGLQHQIKAGPRVGFATGGYTGGGMASAVAQSFSPNFNPTIQNNVHAVFDIDQVANELGKHPEFGRGVLKVFAANKGKLGLR